MQREVKRRHLRFREVDIESESGLLKAYGERIPVLLGPEDTVIAEGRIELGPLRRALRNWASAH